MFFHFFFHPEFFLDYAILSGRFWQDTDFTTTPRVGKGRPVRFCGRYELNYKLKAIKIHRYIRDGTQRRLVGQTNGVINSDDLPPVIQQVKVPENETKRFQRARKVDTVCVCVY